MKTIPIIAALLFSINLFATDPNLDKLKSAVKPGNKVYIIADKPKMAKYAKRKLKGGCWAQVSTLSEANFVLKIEGNGWFAHAEIFDPVTKEQLYRTPSSNTLASATFNTKKKVVKKLIRKHISPMCDPSFFEKMEFNKEF